MEDASIRQRITALVDREHQLRDALVEGRISAETEHAELSSIEVELDQCWDLLRQRDARRRAGLDPDGAESRSASRVEGYLQ